MRSFHLMFRGSPTFTDSNRAILIAWSLSFCSAERLTDLEVAIRAVRNHCLSWLKTELDAIELYRNYFWFERHEVGDPAHFRVGVTIRPCRQTCIADVVVAAQSFVRAKGLKMLNGRQSGLIDVGAYNVPAWNLDVGRCKRRAT